MSHKMQYLIRYQPFNLVLINKLIKKPEFYGEILKKMAEIQNNYGQREITTQTQYLPHNYDINKYNDILESYTDSFLIVNTFNSFFFNSNLK